MYVPMYNLNTQLPAPYQLNSGASTSGTPESTSSSFVTQPLAPPTMARGGRAKCSKKIIAHFNPEELRVLDHLQGHQEICPKTKLRSYSHLEELLKNPHIVGNIHRHMKARSHHAMGGTSTNASELTHLAAGGRHGDTELALIGPHTHHLFNQLAGHSTTNPNTGHPEYWGLGDLLGGAWDAIKGAGRALLPMAGTALGTMIGGPAGGAIGGMGGKWLGGLLSDDESPPEAQALSQGAQKAHNSYRRGTSPRQAAGRGFKHMGSRFGNSGLGGSFRGMGSSLMRGQGFGNSMRNTAYQGFESTGGREGLMNSARNIMGRHNSPSGMKNAFMTEAQQYGRREMPRYEPSQEEGYGEEDGY